MVVERVQCVNDSWPTKPGPQPNNGGITPGYVDPDTQRFVTWREYREALERIEALERELGRAPA